MNTTRRNIIDRLDAVVSRIVQDRDRYCMDCGRFPVRGYVQLTHAHIFPRANMSVRFNPDNGITLCFSCHRHHQEHPVLFMEWMIRHMGRARYEAPERRARTIEDYPEWRLKELYRELKKAA